MIRHVRISKEDQVIPDSDCFAWFDTVRDKFLEFRGIQVWETWEDFESDWMDDIQRQFDLERFRSLFPNASVSISGDEPEYAGSCSQGQDCPNCPNQGWYVVQDSNGDPSQEQCQWCYEVKDSKFNLANASLSIPGGEPGYAPGDC